jgi:hypothetical protein
MSWCSDTPEDEVISLFAGLLGYPDMTLTHKENMTDLHVYTYIHTYTKIIHTHTQISNRKKKHKCRHDEPWRCRQTDKSLVKVSQMRR